MSNWYSKTKDQILIDLETNEQHGLTDEIVSERLKQYGSNELATKQKRTLWQRIFALNNLIYISPFGN
ncbi:ATPase, partial [Staphylococcus sp. MB371]